MGQYHNHHNLFLPLNLSKVATGDGTSMDGKGRLKGSEVVDIYIDLFWENRIVGMVAVLECSRAVW